ncbi:hypothetical protein GCM10010168_27670 [Actinoplanes ianthinogenes]|uniref:DUF7691 domain-containing protein n=1 Tax=Actinoplanes ianthinogenes TaxID=122358 RepID=A0ABM7LKY4_9ACTN|nr:hypothetical protein [Actinoplanes ianthinogenes]BCJ39908.1 hypothetical protein Aiant_05650 [Actinoplanes ianthinogenes]GGR08933.1 hypothetical protein GCM10010168_27670 [Actinoplanes ianthinogenes]
MSYTLELWAAPVDELAARLGAGGADDDPAGKQATPAQLDIVASWLAVAGRPIDSVQHSSAAGDWFEDDVIGGPIAGHLGADLAGHLLSRPLAGLTWDEFPSVGWVRNAEIHAALTGRARADLPDPDTDEGDVVRTVIDALERVMESGQDLVTYYG